MIFSYFPFLFVLFLIVATSGQVLPSSSFCLGNCTTCDPLILTKCTLPYPCDWNFYNEKDSNDCFLAPSTELVLQELGQSSRKAAENLSKGQSQSKKQQYCEYSSSEGKKYIQILGLYSGSQMIEKTFEVDPLSDIYELTFDLLHTPWLPFNDFLLVDITSQKENILSLEISFDSRMSVDTQIAVITCNGVRIMTKKYSIKFANYSRVKNQLTAVFTSFLFNAMWGITNIRVQQGCLSYSIFNPKAQKCNKCDSDAYAVIKQNADWCEKCPSLCKTCQSKLKCTVCVQGASLNKSGVCNFGDKFKSQVALLGQKVQTCDGQFLMGSSSNKVAISELKNDEELLYDEIQLGFHLYYSPNSWKSSTKSYLSIKLNKIQVMKLDYRNMTNVGVTRCLAFKDKRAAKIEIFSSKIVHNDNSAVVEFELLGNQKGMQFGIGAVRVISLIKKKPNTIVNTVPVIETKAESLANISTNTNKSNNQDVGTKTNNTINNSQIKTIPQLPKTIEAKTTPQPTKTIQNKTVPQLPQKNENTTKIPPQPPKITPPEIPKNEAKIIITPHTFPQDQSIKLKPSEASKNTPTTSTSTATTPQKIQVSKFLEDVIANTEQNKSISFITTSSDDQSGIEIHIAGQFYNSTATYNIYINKLDSSQYQLLSYKVEARKLMLSIKIDQSFTDADVAIYSLATSRLLTPGTPQLVGILKIDRFDALTKSQISSLQAFSNVFSIGGWLAVILIFLTVLLGNGVIVQQFIISLQIIFLHVYIGSEYLPLSFRDVIGSLKITKNLNIFIPTHRTNIENNWIGDSTHSCSARFYLLDSQIYFLREFYPIIFLNLIYLIWYGCLYYARKRYNRHLIDQEKQIHHRTIDNIVGRVINFIDQIWRYQFLATMWICFEQFNDISSPRTGIVFNGFVCILAFICSVSWPIFVTIYCRRQYYQRQYSEYLYFYEDIYYCKIPQYQLPSPHHRVGYPIIRTIKLFLLALVICYFGSNPIFSLFTLITIQAGEILYSKIYEMFIDKRYWILRIIQNGLFVIIDFILLVMLLCDKMASSSVYKSMGYLLSAIALIIVINSSIRMAYLAQKKYKQICLYDEEQNYQLKKPKTKRVV